MRERKYLKNPCVVCGEEQIGLHYHETKAISQYKTGLLKKKSGLMKGGQA